MPDGSAPSPLTLSLFQREPRVFHPHASPPGANSSSGAVSQCCCSSAPSPSPAHCCVTSRLRTPLSLQPLHQLCPSPQAMARSLFLALNCSVPSPELFCSPAAPTWEAGRTKVCTPCECAVPMEAPGPGWDVWPSPSSCLRWDLCFQMALPATPSSPSHEMSVPLSQGAVTFTGSCVTLFPSVDPVCIQSCCFTSF